MASANAPWPPVEKGSRKIRAEVTRARKPARTEVPTYQATTAPAKRPARPRRTRVATAGLRAARIRRGTPITIHRIRRDVKSATGVKGPGKKPPSPSPVRSASNVQR
jgi:hypothetical protein